MFLVHNGAQDLCSQELLGFVCRNSNQPWRQPTPRERGHNLNGNTTCIIRNPKRNRSDMARESFSTGLFDCCKGEDTWWVCIGDITGCRNFEALFELYGGAGGVPRVWLTQQQPQRGALAQPGGQATGCRMLHPTCFRLLDTVSTPQHPLPVCPARSHSCCKSCCGCCCTSCVYGENVLQLEGHEDGRGWAGPCCVYLALSWLPCGWQALVAGPVRGRIREMYRYHQWQKHFDSQSQGHAVSPGSSNQTAECCSNQTAGALHQPRALCMRQWLS